MICFYLSRPTLWRVALSFMIWELLSNAHENRPKNRSQFTIAFFWYQSDFLLIILESRTRLWCIGSSRPHIHPSRPPGLSVCRRYPWVEERPLIKRTSGVTRSTQLMGNSLPWWFKLQRADTRRFLIFDHLPVFEGSMPVVPLLFITLRGDWQYFISCLRALAWWTVHELTLLSLNRHWNPTQQDLFRRWHKKNWNQTFERRES